MTDATPLRIRASRDLGEFARLILEVDPVKAGVKSPSDRQAIKLWLDKAADDIAGELNRRVEADRKARAAVPIVAANQ